jgi:hypothetical protein
MFIVLMERLYCNTGCHFLFIIFAGPCFWTNFYYGKYFPSVAYDGSFNLLFLNVHLSLIHLLKGVKPVVS